MCIVSTLCSCAREPDTSSATILLPVVAPKSHHKSPTEGQWEPCYKDTRSYLPCTSPTVGFGDAGDALSEARAAIHAAAGVERSVSVPQSSKSVLIVDDSPAIGIETDHLHLPRNQSLHGEHPDGKSARTSNSVVVVRTHGAVGTALFEYYVESLPSVDVWCLYDGTSQRQVSSIHSLQKLTTQYNNFHFLEVSDSSIKRLLPEVHWPWHSDFMPGHSFVPPIGYYLHLPSLLVLHNHMHQSGIPLPRYFWVLEDDAFFTGHVADFFRHFDKSDEDYIGRFFHASQDFLNHWTHWKQRTFDPSITSGWNGMPPTHETDSLSHGDEKFAPNAPKNQVDIVMKSEHVERISRRLLLKLGEELRKNHVLYGEIYEPTFCHANHDWCTMRRLNDAEFETADLAHYSFFHQESETQLLRDVHDTHLRNKWMHAVKWIKDDKKFREAMQFMPWISQRVGPKSGDVVSQ